MSIEERQEGGGDIFSKHRFFVLFFVAFASAPFLEPTWYSHGGVLIPAQSQPALYMTKVTSRCSSMSVTSRCAEKKNWRGFRIQAHLEGP